MFTLPSESVLTSHLENSSLINNPNLKEEEKQIIQVVAKTFDCKTMCEPLFTNQVVGTLYDLNERINIPELALIPIINKVIDVLKKCSTKSM